MEQGSLHGVVTNMLDCDIIVNGFELQSHYYNHFQINTLGEKGMNLIIPHLWIQKYHYCFFFKDYLALNNPQRLICH